MKHTRPYINELKAGDEVDQVFLVTAKEVKKTKENKPYFDLELSDKTGRISAKMWDNNNNIRDLDKTFTKDDFIQAAGKIDSKYGLQIIIVSLNKVSESDIDLSDFVPQTKQDIELLFAQLKETMESVQEQYLAKLVSSFSDDKDFMDAFKRSPASVKHHQSYLGGLLEHTVIILNLARSLLVSYPNLNRDLLLTGIFLHDIGKIKEYKFRLKSEHTDEGRLVGHTVLSVLMVDEKVKTIKDFPADLLMQLRHLVISHHGERMYGAPVVPMTAEALALHYLDNLDARLAGYYENIENLPPDVKWTNWLESMERRFYRAE